VKKGNIEESREGPVFLFGLRDEGPGRAGFLRCGAARSFDVAFFFPAADFEAIN